VSLVFQKQWTNNAIVDDISSIAGKRDEAPDEENTLDKPIQWKPIEKNVGKELDDTEESKDHPVHQPFGVIVFWCGLNGFNRSIGRVNESDRVTQKLGTVTKDQP